MDRLTHLAAYAETAQAEAGAQLHLWGASIAFSGAPAPWLLAGTALTILTVLAGFWTWRRRASERFKFADANQGRVIYNNYPNARRVRWAADDDGAASAKGYKGPIGKGPNSPSKPRPIGKPGMTNRSDKHYDWKTDILVLRNSGRVDGAKKGTKKIKTRKPGKAPKPK